MHDAEIVQRALLTAVAEIRLVLTSTVELGLWGIRKSVVKVDTAAVSSVTVVSECVTTLSKGSRVHLDLVLARRAAVDYTKTARCIMTRLEELDCLCGRKPEWNPHACEPVVASVAVHVGDISPAHRVAMCSEEEVGHAVLDLALGRNSADRAFGLRDLWLASLEMRLSALLKLGQEEQPWLDATMCAAGGEIEELATTGLDDTCCATGCEPCVWECYYREQVSKRRQGAGSGLKRRRAAEAGPDAPPLLLTPQRMQRMRLLHSEWHTAETLLLTFAAECDSPPSVPWHVRLRLDSLAGGPVTRAYTALRCASGRLQLLVKVHTGGRCTPALAKLAAGDVVQARGPISTDAALHALISGTPMPPALHFLSAGTGIAPMVQICEWLLQRREMGGCSASGARPTSGVGGDGPLVGVSADDGRYAHDDALTTNPAAAAAATADGCPTLRLWSFHRTRHDVMLPAQLASLQLRAGACNVNLYCAYALTREQPREQVAEGGNAATREQPREQVAEGGNTATREQPGEQVAEGGNADPIPDACKRFGATATMLPGRPDLGTLLEGVPREEVRSALLVICGPESFNRAMQQAARAFYEDGHVFVRETPTVG